MASKYQASTLPCTASIKTCTLSPFWYSMPWNIFKKPLCKKPYLESIDEQTQLSCKIFCPFNEDWWIMANTFKDNWGGNATTFDTTDEWNSGEANNSGNWNGDSGANDLADSAPDTGFAEGGTTGGGHSGGCFNCGEGKSHLP